MRTLFCVFLAFVSFFSAINGILAKPKLTPIEIYGAKESKESSPSCRDHDRVCYIFQSAKPLVIRHYSYEIPTDGTFTLNLKVDQAEGEALRRLSQQYLNQHLAIVIDGKIEAVLLVRAELEAPRTQVSLTFKERAELDAIKAALAGNTISLKKPGTAKKP